MFPDKWEKTNKQRVALLIDIKDMGMKQNSYTLKCMEHVNKDNRLKEVFASNSTKLSNSLSQTQCNTYHRKIEIQCIFKCRGKKTPFSNH